MSTSMTISPQYASEVQFPGSGPLVLATLWGILVLAPSLSGILTRSEAAAAAKVHHCCCFQFLPQIHHNFQFLLYPTQFPISSLPNTSTKYSPTHFEMEEGFSQSCKMSILLHGEKSFNQILPQEKRINRNNFGTCSRQK